MVGIEPTAEAAIGLVFVSHQNAACLLGYASPRYVIQRIRSVYAFEPILVAGAGVEPTSRGYEPQRLTGVVTLRK